MQSVGYLKGQTPAAVFTSGFDPLRDVGVEYAHKLDEGGNKVSWHYYDRLAYGWLQMTAWSNEAVDAVKDVAKEMRKFGYGE